MNVKQIKLIAECVLTAKKTGDLIKQLESNFNTDKKMMRKSKDKLIDGFKLLVESTKI